MNSKKYYWLKLKNDFFETEEVKIIEAQENGSLYIIFYLKLLLKSTITEGRLMFRDYLPYDEKMLSNITNTNIDIVRSACKIFNQLGLMELQDDGALFMLETQSMIGNETEYAIQKRKYRDKILHTNSDNVLEVSKKCPTDIRDKILDTRVQSTEYRVQKEEKSKSEKEKSFSSQFLPIDKSVSKELEIPKLTDDEYDTLCDEYDHLLTPIKVKFKDNHYSVDYFIESFEDWVSNAKTKSEKADRYNRNALKTITGWIRNETGITRIEIKGNNKEHKLRERLNEITEIYNKECERVYGTEEFEEFHKTSFMEFYKKYLKENS